MKRLSLRSVFVLSAIFVILVTGCTVGYISYVNSSAVVRAVSRERYREVSARVVEHLKAFMVSPCRLLTLNVRLLSQGVIPVSDPQALSFLFQQQVAVPSAVASVYFGNPQGGVTGAGRAPQNQRFFTIGTGAFQAGPLTRQPVTPDGQRVGDEEVLSGAYDARRRPWYRAAVEHNGEAWSDIYLVFSGTALVLSPSRVVRAPDGRFLGVVAADIHLSKISRFLEGLHRTLPGLTYILDDHGFLVATSTGELPFHVGEVGQINTRLRAVDSATVEVAESAALIETGANRLGAVGGETAGAEGGTETSVQMGQIGGSRHLIGVTPFRDPRGLSWRIVTVVPTAFYEAPIINTNLRTVALIVLAVAIMAAVSIVLVRRMLSPLADVANTARAVGLGDLSRTLPVRRQDEIGAVAQAINDMVRRLQGAQIQHQRQLARLAFTENRYRNLFQNAEVAICNEDFSDLMAALARLRAEGVTDLRTHLQENPALIRDLAGRIRVVECNAATRRLFGLGPGNKCVSPIERYASPGGADAFVEQMCAIWEQASVFRSEFRVKTMTGEDRTVRLSLPVPKVPEDYRIVPVSLVDLTVRKQAEEALRQKNTELERSNTELESFAHVAAHDLREPLRTLASYTTLLRRRVGPRLTPEEAEFLGFIHQGALRMDALISDLLEFARVGRSTEAVAPVDLGAVVTRALSDLHSQIEAVNADIQVATPLPRVEGHAEEMVRVFTNLIGNAIKYRQSKGPLRIVIGATVQPVSETEAGEEKVWQVFVRDNGIGLPSGHDYEQRIFRLFQRLHPRDAHGGGTGIGLSICKKVIEHHGGRIWAESPGENQGCSIVFTLPYST